MNIKILDSWLREYLKTEANPSQIAEKLSLTSLSTEKLEKLKNDYLYEFEITTNRPDLFSVVGIAREANAILPRFGIKSEFKELEFKNTEPSFPFPIEIINDPKLVNRICAAILEVRVGKSPPEIAKRLEASAIRSLNNLVDVTNYVMRTIGHPAHVFDLDRLNTKKIFIREARGGEIIQTLDNKKHTLLGGEIVAIDDKERIVDLLGIMGLKNSVVTDKTKRILFFIDNNEPYHIRKTSMGLAVRTEAATLNEKGVDPELAIKALNFGISLYKKTAEGKLLNRILDVYPNKPKKNSISVSLEKVNTVVGIPIDIKSLAPSLERLGFKLSISTNNLVIDIPSFRANDIAIEEDIIEEIARIHGYNNLPGKLVPTEKVLPYRFEDEFYWERRAKNSLKYWGFTELYTYSFVSEEMFEAEEKSSIKIRNPLTEDFVYMRTTLVPSLLKTVSENKKTDEVKIFEMANVYIKKANALPDEIPTLSGVVRKKNLNFYEVKGIVEQLLTDFGIKNYSFKVSEKSAVGASIFINNECLGEIEVFDSEIIDFELNFNLMIKHASSKKTYKPLGKFPPIVEDLSVIVSDSIETQEIINEIKLKSSLINNVTLKDQFENSRTFHIIYQSEEKNLTNEEVSKIRENIIDSLKKKFDAKIK